MSGGDGKSEASASSQRVECPRCGCQHFIAVDVRIVAKAIVRRRQCRYCGRCMTIREQISV